MRAEVNEERDDEGEEEEDEEKEEAGKLDVNGDDIEERANGELLASLSEVLGSFDG